MDKTQAQEMASEIFHMFAEYFDKRHIKVTDPLVSHVLATIVASHYVFGGVDERRKAQILALILGQMDGAELLLDEINKCQEKQ